MSQQTTIRFTLNGREVEVAAPPLLRLLDVLRDLLGLTGTKNCCGEGDCGACTVVVDGAAAVSCLLPVVQLEGADVRTIESLAGEHGLHPLQQAFLDHGGTQCGICAPGFLMAAHSHLERGGATTDAALRKALSGVLCRCTGYNRVIESVQQAGEKFNRDPEDADGKALPGHSAHTRIR